MLTLQDPRVAMVLQYYLCGFSGYLLPIKINNSKVYVSITIL